MQAGKLDQRVTITPVVRTQAANFGETVESPDTGHAVVVWASVRQQGAAERQRNGITTTDNSYAIRIRWRDGIDTTATITYGSRTLSASSVIGAGKNNRQWLDIVAMEAA